MVDRNLFTYAKPGHRPADAPDLELYGYYRIKHEMKGMDEPVKHIYRLIAITPYYLYIFYHPIYKNIELSAWEVNQYIKAGQIWKMKGGRT